jgi:hypothetical protein
MLTPAILAIIQGILACIPAGEGLVAALVGLKVANPNMTQDDINNLMQQITATIALAGADELATLALIPAAPVKGA